MIFIPPSGNESVVISHGIVTANIATIFQITIIQQLKKAGFLKSAFPLSNFQNHLNIFKYYSACNILVPLTLYTSIFSTISSWLWLV